MKNTHSQKGFSLVELSIVLLIFGSIVATLMFAFKIYNQKSTVENTRLAMNLSQGAMFEFYSITGRYPCPADPTVPRTSPSYGREASPCPGGAGIVSGPGRDADGVGGPDTVLIGTVPFQTLLDPDNNPATVDGVTDIPLTEQLTVDGWGRKLTYAVTESMAVSATYNYDRGAIDIVDEYNRSILDIPGSAHLSIISHGITGRGGYTREGVLVDSCPGSLPLAVAPAVATAKNEVENCNGDGTFLSGLRNEKNHSFNDDYIQFMINDVSNHWTYVNIGKVMNTNAGSVGVGTNTPVERLHVMGDLRAEKVQSDRYCMQNDPSKCMTPSSIAGNDPNMKCANPDEAVIAIEQNKVVCAKPFPDITAPPTGYDTSCAPGDVMIGISSLTGVLCTAAPP